MENNVQYIHHQRKKKKTKKQKNKKRSLKMMAPGIYTCDVENNRAYIEQGVLESSSVNFNFSLIEFLSNGLCNFLYSTYIHTVNATHCQARFIIENTKKTNTSTDRIGLFRVIRLIDTIPWKKPYLLLILSSPLPLIVKHQIDGSVPLTLSYFVNFSKSFPRSRIRNAILGFGIIATPHRNEAEIFLSANFVS